MGMKRMVALVAMAAICAGCGAPMLNRSMTRVENGMTKEQVVDIMGKTEDRSTNGNREAWRYTAFTGNLHDYCVIIWFRDGTVYAKTTYREWADLRPIDWSKAPD